MYSQSHDQTHLLFYACVRLWPISLCVSMHFARASTPSTFTSVCSVAPSPPVPHFPFPEGAGGWAAACRART